MNPLRFVLQPIENLADAVLMPLKALFVVALCGLVNWMTYSGQWWVKWVALGMGIAVVVAWARAARTLLVLALVAWVGWKIYQRYGEAGRARWDDWVRRARPQAAEVMELLRSRDARARVAEPGRAA